MVSKKKTSNPLDNHRKAARQRELKKNREQRDRAREVALVQRDVRPLQQEIRTLEARSRDGKAADPAVEEELKELKAELGRIRSAKEEHVKAHPEHRKLVYPHEEEEKAEQQKREAERRRAVGQEEMRLQRDPRRSVYYHAVFNPLGAPPPGMPYIEKPPGQLDIEQSSQFGDVERGSNADGGLKEQAPVRNEVEQDSSDRKSYVDDDNDDDDIALPAGPPPLRTDDGDVSDSSSDSDGIVMPQGPPPSQPPSGPRAMRDGIPSQHAKTNAQPPLPPAPPPPSSFMQPWRPTASLHPIPHARPPFRGIPSAPNRDPLALDGQQSIPYQAWHNRPRPPPTSAVPSASLPPRPSSSVTTSGPPGPPPSRPAAVISAAPVLRDLKKEATAFVPTALRKRQAAAKAKAAKGGLPNAVNPAPGADRSSAADEDSGETMEKVDLIASLRPHLSQHAGGPATKNGAGQSSQDDDYQKFLGEVGDLL